ncbi:MinD/ParA family ATP-binding protein [Halosimplex salinum]|uniref:MinD/ParA family ATP-binding protein n=1 Tax=Halosimplex salinum TaxID=1710538 RepID=UPI000F478856|nr:P-loop NTPase [Halosimplex salinum]
MILAVCGGKGGVGKSTVSLNLSRELDAVAVDADLATPDLPRGRGPDLHDVLTGRAAPMEAVETVDSIELLPCGRTLAGARAADLTKLPKTLAMVDRQYGRVVVDCPAGLARDVGYQIHGADAVVLVTTHDRPALLNAFRTRHLAGELDTPVAGVVLNKATDEEDREVADRVENEMGATTTVVPRHSTLATSFRAGRPLRDHDPECPALPAFETLTDRIEESERQISEDAELA